MIVAGGGVIYSEATDALRRFVDATGIAVGETQAGKGALPEPHPLSLGGIGATGTRAANRLARDADLVIVIGSRLSDFTTASKTAFQHERVRFIAINVAELDAGKHGALPLVGDARAVLEELLPLLAGYRVGARVHRHDRTRRRPTGAPKSTASVPPASAKPPDGRRRAARQSQWPGGRRRRSSACCRTRSRPTDVIVCAAGSLPGRPAQAVAGARSEGLSPRVRLLVHGLRDRRRPRREDGGAGSRASTCWSATART